MLDVKMIIDQYKLYHRSLKRGLKNNPKQHADELSRLAQVFGRNVDLTAIVDAADTDGMTAFQKAGFTLLSVNGDRSQALREFIRQTNNQISMARPRNLIVVTSDPQFTFLLDHANQYDMNLALWAPQDSFERALLDPIYNWRPLEELLPESKVARIDIRLDYENLHIGLVKRGWKPNPKALIEAIKSEVSVEGKIGNIVAYADWGQLSNGSGQDFQRDIAMIGVETQYLVNINGKNSADMKIADDISMLVAKDSNASDSVDIIVLGTNDRDFRPVVDTTQSQGKKVILIGLKDGMSSQFKESDIDIRYIDQYFDLGDKPEPPTKDAFRKYAELAIRAEVWFNQQGWQSTYPNKLADAMPNELGGIDTIRQAIADGIFVPSNTNKGRNKQGNRGSNMIMCNPKHPLIQTVRDLLDSVPQSITFGLLQRKLDYVDTNLLLQGLRRNNTLHRRNVGQQRQDAEFWLNLVAESGIVETRQQPHPRNPEKMLTTWWLPEEYMDEALMLRWLVTTADSRMAGQNENWVGIKKMQDKLSIFKHGAFQLVLKRLETQGEIRLEKHKLSGRKHAVTGLHLSDDGESITSVRSERGQVIASLKTIANGSESLTVASFAKQLRVDNSGVWSEELIRQWWSIMQKERLLLSAPNGKDGETFVLQHRHPLLKAAETTPVVPATSEADKAACLGQPEQKEKPTLPEAAGRSRDENLSAKKYLFPPVIPLEQQLSVAA